MIVMMVALVMHVGVMIVMMVTLVMHVGVMIVMMVTLMMMLVFDCNGDLHDNGGVVMVTMVSSMNIIV